MKMLKRMLPWLAVGFIATSAMAAVDSSHHDMKAYKAATEVCLYCHGITDTASQPVSQYGEVGSLCLARCHYAGGFSDANAIPNRPAFIHADGTVRATAASPLALRVDDGFAHGLDPLDLLDPKDGTTVETFSTVGTNFPYGATASMECTSCHNVHDNTNTPFLQTPLFTGGPVASRSFCEACHNADRGSNWAAAETAPNGEHPVNFDLTTGDVNRTNAERIIRYIKLDGNVFDTLTPNGAALNAAATHYQTGGHVSGWGNVTGTLGAQGMTFGCYTCHSAHLDGGTTQPENLALGESISTDGTWSPLCVGCHGDNATDFAEDPNPGAAASAYFHPVGPSSNAGTAAGNLYTYTTSTGSFTFVVNLAPIITLTKLVGSVTDTTSGIETATGKPRCTSCHDVHGGITNSQLLIDLDGTRDSTYVGKICDACHGAEGLPDVADDAAAAGEPANSHHRTAGNWSAATILDADNNTLILDAASWLTAADRTNGLGCADCHVFESGTLNHSTAHNW